MIPAHCVVIRTRICTVVMSDLFWNMFQHDHWFIISLIRNLPWRDEESPLKGKEGVVLVYHSSDRHWIAHLIQFGHIWNKSSYHYFGSFLRFVYLDSSWLVIDFLYYRIDLPYSSLYWLVIYFPYYRIDLPYSSSYGLVIYFPYYRIMPRKL